MGGFLYLREKATCRGHAGAARRGRNRASNDEMTRAGLHGLGDSRDAFLILRCASRLADSRRHEKRPPLFPGEARERTVVEIGRGTDDARKSSLASVLRETQRYCSAWNRGACARAPCFGDHREVRAR
jgi:hypothetical protein